MYNEFYENRGKFSKVEQGLFSLSHWVGCFPPPPMAMNVTYV